MGRKGKFRPPSKRERAESAASAAHSETDTEHPFVSRGGLKLRRALDAFARDAFGLVVPGLWCADLGCSTGGFTDCLLQAGAARVYSVDTAYGELAWKIRTDDRVVVMERTNAVHAEVPGEVMERGGVDLVVIDLGWTAQARAIPAALRWVRGGDPRLVPGARSEEDPGAPQTAKPSAGECGERRQEHGEAFGVSMAPGDGDTRGGAGRIVSLIKPHYEVSKDELGGGGVLDPIRAEAVTEEVLAAMPGLGVRVLGCVESPLLGGRLGGKKKGAGNREWLALLEPIVSDE